MSKNSILYINSIRCYLGGEKFMFEERDNCNIKFKKCCIDVVIFILAILFAFVIGVIVGALTGLFAALGLGAFVALAVILAVLIIIRIIMLACFGIKKDKKDKYDCCR